MHKTRSRRKKRRDSQRPTYKVQAFSHWLKRSKKRESPVIILISWVIVLGWVAVTAYLILEPAMK